MAEQGLAGTWLQRELPGIKVKKIDDLTTIADSEPSTCCPICKTMSTNTVWQFNHWVCPVCDEHLPMQAVERLKWLFDQYDFVDEIGKDLYCADPLNFVDKKPYTQRLQEATLAMQSMNQSKHKKASDYQGRPEALVALKGQIKDLTLVACAFEFQFMGGSMGTVVGDRFVLAGEMALREKIPLVCFATSGGARMQEGVLSLMQMARTSAIIQQLRQAGLPYLVVLTNPVYGGVTASLAMLGDVHLAEPKAMIGFAGKRVIEQTVREKLQEPFQRAEFLAEHGVIDQVVHRHQLKDTIYRLLTKMMFYQSDKANYSNIGQV